MKKLIIYLSTGILLLSSISSLFYSLDLFENYHSKGRELPDKIYSVPLDSHGTVQYISKDQNNRINSFFYIAGLCFIFSAGGLIWIQKNKVGGI